MISLRILIFTSVVCLCSSQNVIFEDNFSGSNIDESKWSFEETLSGGSDWQFQWFVKDSENTFIRDGILHIKPTLTADKFSEDALYEKKVVIENCTSHHNYGCERQGTDENILNPIRSASIQTKTAFKYGTVEIKAKLPAGDWLKPSIKLLPSDDVYGSWPRSGEIDFIEARGNRQFLKNNKNFGINQITSTLHFGPKDNSGWEKAHFKKSANKGFNEEFHVYKLDWNENGIKLFIDNVEHGNVTIEGEENFWNFGEFKKIRKNQRNLKNPWVNGTQMAPFDQEFYIVIGLAVGGVGGYFPDKFKNEPHPKPWPNTSQNAPLQFWQAKDKWYKTWTVSPDSADFQIDFVKVLSK